MARNTEEAPRPGPVSVDFNALHNSMKAGEDGDKALAKSVFAETVADRPEDGAVAADPFAGFDRPGLQERLRGLSIPFESDANMDRLKELLRGHPQGVPQPENPGVITSSEPGADAQA